MYEGLHLSLGCFKGREGYYVLVKVGLYYTPTIFLTYDSFFFVLFGDVRVVGRIPVCHVEWNARGRGRGEGYIGYKKGAEDCVVLAGCSSTAAYHSKGSRC